MIIGTAGALAGLGLETTLAAVAVQAPSVAAKWQSATELIHVVVEVARAITYIGLALFTVALVAWAFVNSGSREWEWSHAVVVVFSLALLAAAGTLLYLLFT